MGFVHGIISLQNPLSWALGTSYLHLSIALIKCICIEGSVKTYIHWCDEASGSWEASESLNKNVMQYLLTIVFY